MEQGRQYAAFHNLDRPWDGRDGLAFEAWKLERGFHVSRESRIRLGHDSSEEEEQRRLQTQFTALRPWVQLTAGGGPVQLGRDLKLLREGLSARTAEPPPAPPAVTSVLSDYDSTEDGAAIEVVDDDPSSSDGDAAVVSEDKDGGASVASSVPRRRQSSFRVEESVYLPLQSFRKTKGAE